MLGGLVGWTDAARRRSPRAGVAGGLAALALGAVACGGSQPVARAFGSTEIEPIRDPTIFLDGESSAGVVQYSTGGAAGVAQVWWTLDLTTGAVQSYGTSMPPFMPPIGSSPPPTPPPSSLYTCVQNYAGGDPPGTVTLQIVDTTTNVETDIHNVKDFWPTCPGADGMLTAFVLDASGGIVLETGPYTQLTQAELTVAVLAILGWDLDAMGTPTSVTVLAAQVTSPDEDEIDSIDLSTYPATFDVTAVVPAVQTSVAWATGATPVGSLQSTSLAGSTAGIQFIDGHYLYPRSMSDGGTTIFAGPFSSGAASELALFEIPPGTLLPTAAELDLVGGGTAVPKRYLFTWTFDGGSGPASNIIVWDDTDLALAVCPSSHGVDLASAFSSDHAKVLFSVAQGFQDYYNNSGPLDLLTLGGPGGAASCRQIASDGVVAAGFSPDADFMFWVIQPPTGDSQLWIAGSDGSGAQMIGRGVIAQAHFLDDGGARLEMILDGELAWLDLHDASGPPQHLAEQVHGSIYDFNGNPWLILLYQWNATDGTGTLALVNRVDGQVRPISPSVAEFEVEYERLGADGGPVDPFGDAGVGYEYVVVYVVRGRNPSAQDGIWRAIITPADLQ